MSFTRFDVYLNFRGEDTGHSFTDHLYTALKGAAIRTFRDAEDVESGEDFSHETVKAIENSRGSIVVLSETYAYSTWCLDELSLILEQRRKRNHFVLPVFYHVEPSDVRKQRCSFAIQGSKGTEENVNRWKFALTDVANFSGFVASGSEADLIARIVDTVESRLDRKRISPPPALSHAMFQVPENMKIPLDVFLSFRGEDTGHSFTDHLYTALKGAAIRTFRDDLKFERGQDFKHEMVKAIGNSRGSIVVFSENYAESSWCLEDLSFILEQRRKGNHFVLPVFYKVDPSYVRNKLRSVVKERPSWTQENMNRWNSALREFAYLTGFVASGSEAKLIAKIVDAVEYKLKLLSHHESLQVPERLKIPLEVIQLATENFDKNFCVGSGGYGAVYKAELSIFNIGSYFAIKLKSKDEPSQMCCTVAIKRIFSTEDSQGKEGFLAEIDVLSRCEHPNIVSLLGCCVEGGEMLLVYEYASNGSLDDYLGSTDKMVYLTWAKRLKMCINIAEGLSYLHKHMEDKRRIIHRDIKSANILLGENWEAKIADFGLSKLFPMNHQASTINTNNIAGTSVYLDPEYDRTGSLKRASDIYSFGVVLFEIFSGKLAYDSVYMKEKKKGLAPIAKRHLEMGTLVKEILDLKTMDDEAYELDLTLKIRPDRDSLDAFSRIAYQCLAKAQANRPTIDDVINELNKALYFQENRMKTLRFSLDDIKMGVENFNDDNCIMRGGYGTLYKGKVQYNNSHKEVVVKRFNEFGQEDGFLKEFEVLFRYRQENIIGLVGYCKEMDEKIIVYEHASMGSLDRYLNEISFTWIKRLKICIDIAKGLQFLHGGDVGQDVVIHGDIKSSNILLTKDWKVKICGFEHALTYPPNKEIEYVISDVAGSPGYCDPLFLATNIMTKEYDIYSFGVILFELLCGRSACLEDVRDHGPLLDVLVKSHYEAAQLEEIVFEGIKKHILLKSFAIFRRIAYKCLHEDRDERPTASDVVVQLQKALEFQEEYETRKANLDETYKEMLHEFSECPEAYSAMREKNIYSILSKRFLLEHDKSMGSQEYYDVISSDDNG